MHSFYRQLQRSTCYGQQAQAKEKNFKNYGKSNKELNALIEKKFQKFIKKQEKEENRKRAPALSRNANFQ